MNIPQDDWRDGVGYDTTVLADISPSERSAAVELLARRLETDPDWREVEALACMETPGCAPPNNSPKWANPRTSTR